MRFRQPATIALLATLVAPLAAVDAGAITYRWVDAEGNLQLSDTLPPRAASQGYKVLDPATGEVIREVPAEKSAAQKAREEARQAAERRAAERAQREAEEQARHDRILRSLYSSTADIERVRDERLDRIDSRIRQMERSIERMEQALATGHEKAGYARDLEQLRESLEETRTERRAVAERFDADLRRFRELQSGR